MGIFNFRKKKEHIVSNSDMLGDVSFIKEMHHIQNGVWHQYDILLDARPYGWDYMVDMAEYMNQIDLENVGNVSVSEVTGSPDIDLIEKYRASGNSVKSIPEISVEQGTLGIGGISSRLNDPVKIVWINQTNVLRLFSISPDESLIRKYVETAVRRTFGTEDEMKAGRPHDK